MLRISLCAVLLLLARTPGLGAQDRGNGALPKEASAVRVADGAIRVDGRLDDQAWRQAGTITDFIQKEPIEGVPPTEGMDVRIVYDSGAIYIGARMHNREQVPIQAPMGRRDSVEDQAEHLLVSLDTFHDRRTAYAFGVTATGVRLDRFYAQDDETVFDEGFDPVWEARTAVDEEGWTAELWIPFSQLRFNEQTEQVWGLNLQRFIPTRNELDYWVAVPRTQKGWASHFGDLRGIQDIRPTKRVELLPYVAGASTVNGDRDRSNPFDTGGALTGRVGADLKMGLGPNLTFEATVNPDFGQIEADPAEVNLSAFETIFPEKRPFFTEGAALLNMAAINNFFNSRRIGAPPVASVSGDYVDYPRTATLLTAAKLTGRLPSGTSLGMLAAVTDEESARISNRGSALIQTVRVAPRAAYGVARLQQEVGPSASWVSVMASGVHRNLTATDPLAALLVRNALGLGSDSLLRLKEGEYEMRTWTGATFLSGESAAIERVQRSSFHYLQRPDKTYALLDPTRTSLPGYKFGVSVNRTGGRHWLWAIFTDVESPGYETNDFGRLRNADGLRGDVSVRYRETQPGRIFRSYSINVANNNTWNYGRNRQSGTVQQTTNLTWKNFWTTQFTTTLMLRNQDAYLTRGGPLMGTPLGWNTVLLLRSSATTQTGWNARIQVSGNEDGGLARNLTGGVSVRPWPRWLLSLDPEFSHEVGSQQYVTALAGGRPEVFGRRHIFSFIDRNTYSTQIRLSFTLKPDMNLDVYAEPFAASGRYYDFGELLAARRRQRLVYGTSGTTVEMLPDGSRTVTDGSAAFTLRNYDFNVRSFRSNIVLRWEWRPGSTLYLVWQQDRNLSEAISDRVGLSDMFGSLTAPGSNYFVIKTSFWLPVR